MRIKRMSYDVSVCKVKDVSQIDMDDNFCFVGKTDEEISLVCKTEKVPTNTMEREDGWKAVRIEGVLDFSLIGILAKISGILAENEIGIFVISTFNTDYILTKSESFEAAITALKKEGYEII